MANSHNKSRDVQRVVQEGTFSNVEHANWTTYFLDEQFSHLPDVEGLPRTHSIAYTSDQEVVPVWSEDEQ